MSTLTIVRNNDVLFLSAFEDTAPIPILPTSVLLRVAYKVQGEATIEEIQMTDQGSGMWKGVWQNDDADVGIVQWAILADGGNHAADEGYFMLAANKANPQTIV